MRGLLIFVLIALTGTASATTYYVSSSAGSDLNSGTSSAASWKTLAKANAQVLQPGDSVLLRRGDVWNESLVPSASGTQANPITFDAYGSGAPPTLSGYYAVPASSWVLVTGNAWKAPLPATFSSLNFTLFGSIWGQKVAAATSNLKGKWDFYLANGSLYVYSVGNPSSYYTGPIVPMALSNVPVINVNGKSWLTFQHILVNWFDQYGVYVQGPSDHLVFGNMEADSMIPQGTQPLGFYVNASTAPGDIKIYNSEAHLNYDGFRFDGAASAITMVNDKAYANRDGALVDNTGAVSYSYCHFYASSLAVAGSTDVLATTGSGPIAGLGNVSADTAPLVQAWQRYPAEVTLTLDDAGMTAGADTYYEDTVLPIADAAGVPVGVAVTVGYPLAQTLIPKFQQWVDAGRDVTSHSMSHTYYTNLDALDLRYTGTGTAARLSISNKILTITVTGAGDSVTYNLAQGQPQGTILGLEQALNATGHFTAAENPVCQGPYGASQRFYLSQRPFQQNRPAFINERYVAAALDPKTWAVKDPTSALSTAAQALQINGGAGQDGQTTVVFSGQIELGGALEFQHGEVTFTSGAKGIIGGLYSGGISTGQCLAGFQVTPSGTLTKIQALINGSATGPVITTTAGHRYLLTTYIYSREIYRRGDLYHSSVHAAGNGCGGTDVPSDVRVVLELQDFNPTDPSTLVNPATVLWDDLIANAPGFCTYALVNAISMQCSIASTYAAHISTAEVRVALPNSDYSTQLVESLADGGQCFIANLTTLDFYPQFVPASMAKIVASYRGAGRAVAEVADIESIAELQSQTDDGVRGIVRTIESPTARTQIDCENAALALLDDSVIPARRGTYDTWSDFLPGQAGDIFPGDAITVKVPSRHADFTAIVRGVAVDIRDLPTDRSVYTIEFANDAAEPLAIQQRQTATAVPLQDLPVRLTVDQVGSYYLDNLPDAQITEITSTTVQIDAGVSLKSGCGIEIRSHDFGWGVANDRTLLGRFGSRTFSLPRWARTQTYFLRMYNSSSPPRYSRYASALHVDSSYE